VRFVSAGYRSGCEAKKAIIKEHYIDNIAITKKAAYQKISGSFISLRSL